MWSPGPAGRPHRLGGRSAASLSDPVCFLRLAVPATHFIGEERLIQKHHVYVYNLLMCVV